MNAPLYKPFNLTLADKWREMYNPLEWLTLRQITGWLYLQQLGASADITWLYEFIERRHPTLMACVLRRTSAMEKLDWDVKTTVEEQLPEGCTKAMAEKQREKLFTHYQAIDNLKDAINWMALADFRGFGHLEKHFGDNLVTHLEPVPHWNWSRSGRSGAWLYNKRALPIYATPDATPPDLTPIDPANFIIREVGYPIDEIAVFAFFRSNLAQKDWDGFCATFGIPPIFIEMPENMPLDKQAEYQAVAERIVGDARGTLPNGAKVQTVDAGSRGKNPFLEHMEYQNEMIVLAATGGKLTMLTESGSGTLAGGAHKDTFDEIAEANAAKISEIFQQQFDAGILEEYFPGQPVLARFALAGKELTDTGAICTDVKTLAAAGWMVQGDQIEEKTGYRVSDRPPVDKAVIRAEQGDPGVKPVPPSENRRRRLGAFLMNRGGDPLEALVDSVHAGITRGDAKLWEPVANRVKALLDSPDDHYFAEVQRLIDDIPSLLKPAGVADPDVKAWQNGLGALLAEGLTQPESKTVAIPAGKGAA